jgi:predicted nucleic-acid-binding Zn-ribbon protein
LKIKVIQFDNFPIPAKLSHKKKRGTMRDGICPKCQSKNVYLADMQGLHAGVIDLPKIQLYRENKWIPDIDILHTTAYLCQNCGYFEFYVQDPSKLERLSESDNWKRVK